MAPTWSPPTRRVVAVVELIAESERPLSVSVIAERLSLARATVTAVLGELRAARWVTRDDRLCYRPGPALTRLSGPETAVLGVSVRAEDGRPGGGRRLRDHPESDRPGPVDRCRQTLCG